MLGPRMPTDRLEVRHGSLQHLYGLAREVEAAGEFGRTPRVGQRLTDAAATANGRDHWTRVYSVLWAGGGVRGGLVYGASDKHAAEPAHHPITPADLAASLFHALGVNPHGEVQDRQGRPHALTLGEPILPLFA